MVETEGSGSGGWSGFLLDAAAVVTVLAGIAGWAAGFRWSWSGDELQQAGGAVGHGCAVVVRQGWCMHQECLNAEGFLTSLVSLKPLGLFGGEGTVI